MDNNDEQEYVDFLSIMKGATEGGLTEEQEDIFRNSCGASGRYGFISGIQHVEKLIGIYTDGIKKFPQMFEEFDFDTVDGFSDFIIKMIHMNLRDFMMKYEEYMDSSFPKEVEADA